MNKQPKPSGKEWKEFWRAQEEDPETRQKVRREKRAARRRAHKQDRRAVRDQLLQDPDER